MKQRKAVRECKRGWRLVLEGKAENKADIIRLLPHYVRYRARCPLCQYAFEQWERRGLPTELGLCNFCPLVEQTGWLCNNSEISYGWKPEVFASVIMALKE